MADTAQVSVVIPCHTERNWDTLVRAVAAALGQRPLPPAEVVVVVDHNPALLERARRHLAGVTVLENRFEPGASGNRNTGARHTTTPLIAFLDGDITAGPDWLAQLIDPFADPEVVGTGGAIAAAWSRSRPNWLPDELLWAFGASYTGMPTTTAAVRNVWSASMAVRRDVFTAVGGFRDGFGKIGNRNRPEDTELCLRMSEGGGRWMYVPDAVVEHDVPPERSTFRFLMRRCYAEGRGKVQMARLLRGSRTLGAERSYLTRTLPRAVLREVSGTVRAGGPGRAQHASRAGTVMAAVAAAAVGGAVETLGATRR
ncbi:glycosyltransferase family 2 protein [Actinoplanes sp. NPDC049118]|uniref:glycosyltransferase n=1 Tax=Actinoplanes sp. NPDC049118 TaxID=3155769 RepID=UPI003409E8CF